MLPLALTLIKTKNRHLFDPIKSRAHIPPSNTQLTQKRLICLLYIYSALGIVVVVPVYCSHIERKKEKCTFYYYCFFLAWRSRTVPYVQVGIKALKMIKRWCSARECHPGHGERVRHWHIHEPSRDFIDAILKLGRDYSWSPRKNN